MAETQAGAAPGPDVQWLNRVELRNALNLGDRAIDAMIRAGRFPRGTNWDGKEHRWPAYVVVWFRLQKALEPLMQAGTDPDEDAGDETRPPKK